MFNHAPEGYDCPFCRLTAGGEDHLTAQHDIVLRRERALAFVASRWWPDPATAEERAPYDHRLRTYFTLNPS